MSDSAVIPLAALHFERNRLGAALVLDNIGQNGGVLKRIAQRDFAVPAGQQHAIERMGLTRFGRETFNFQRVPSGDPILFSTGFNDCVHNVR